MLVSSAENRRYLSGFTGSAGYLLISEGGQVLVTDFRYTEQAERQSPGYRVERMTAGQGWKWLPELATDTGVSRIGFEASDVSVAVHSAFRKAIDEHEDSPDLTLVETSDLVDKMRAVKDRDELEVLSKAVEVTDRALESVAATVAPGVTEGEVAWELEKSMREQGAEGLAFETIVAAGPNGALPHHLADETPIQEGQAVVIDMGAKYDGYCADLTRTIVVGEPDEKFAEVYGTVLRAQIEAEERVRPGMTGKEVDAISRDIIADAGYGDNFGHSLGHGVGPRRARVPARRPDRGRCHRGRHGVHHRARHLPVRLGRRADRGHRGHGRWARPRAQPRPEDRGRRVGPSHPPFAVPVPARIASGAPSVPSIPGEAVQRLPPSVFACDWDCPAHSRANADGARRRRPRYNRIPAAHKPL